MRTFLLSCFVVFYCLLSAQPVLVEDFEANNYDNWTVVEGFAETQVAQEYSGAIALRLFKRDGPAGAQTTLLHNSFSENWGIYEMACYVEGDISDAQFIFQYVDDENYYQISCNPRGTDNPQLILYKVSGGIFKLLDSVGPVVDLNDWFLLKVEHYCDGTLIVSIDNEPKISVNDRSIDQPGTIGLAAWGESVYFDEITFESANNPVVTDLKEFVCSGRFYQVDTNRYNETGVYLDTLQTAQGCDSIIRLELTIVPHYLVTIRDTICAHDYYLSDIDTISSRDYYLFDIDTIRAAGRYNKSLQSQYGCDSLVELILTVLGSDILAADTFLCPEQFFIFGGDTITESGTYFDTLFSPDGCFSVLQQKVFFSDLQVNLGADTTVCFDDTPNIPLGVSGFDSLQWFDGRTAEKIAISAPGEYWVQAFFEGCEAYDTINISEFCEPQLEVYIPNAFSPNGDQINDIFMPEFVAIPTSYRMLIFNRWGSQIFKSEEYGVGWQGMADGRLQPPGVYLYFIEIDGKQFTGSATLIR